MEGKHREFLFHISIRATVFTPTKEMHTDNISKRALYIFISEYFDKV